MTVFGCIPYNHICNTTKYYQILRYYFCNILWLSILTFVKFLGYGARAETPDSEISGNDSGYHVGDDVGNDEMIDQHAHNSRQKARAQARPVNLNDVMARIAGPLSESTSKFVENLEDYFVIPEGSMEDGHSTEEYQAQLRTAANDISRSQYEIYSFATRHDPSEAAINKLTALVSNVSALDLKLPIMQSKH